MFFFISQAGGRTRDHYVFHLFSKTLLLTHSMNATPVYAFGNSHRHLSNIDCLMACTACLVCFISTVDGCIKKKKPWKTGASSGHITNLKQSILETFYRHVNSQLKQVRLFHSVNSLVISRNLWLILLSKFFYKFSQIYIKFFSRILRIPKLHLFFL